MGDGTGLAGDEEDDAFEQAHAFGVVVALAGDLQDIALHPVGVDIEVEFVGFGAGQVLGIFRPGADHIQLGPDGQAGPLRIDRRPERLGASGAGQQAGVEKQGLFLAQEVAHGAGIAGDHGIALRGHVPEVTGHMARPLDTHRRLGPEQVRAQLLEQRQAVQGIFPKPDIFQGDGAHRSSPLICVIVDRIMAEENKGSGFMVKPALQSG